MSDIRFCWRITRYNPQYRDHRGAYLKNEWTCYSEIGKIIEGKKFTLEEYWRVENAYIKAIILFMECLHIESLKVTDLEKNGERPEKISFDGIGTITNGESIQKEAIISLVQLILRSEVWCKLESPEMYVHFGWDYYMFIGSSESCISVIKAVEQLGLFVEEFESPYSDEEDDE